MARSRFGDNQFVDVDVLSEAEHLEVDHSTVSGVVTDFISLDDVPSTYEVGKYLYATASGLAWRAITVSSGTPTGGQDGDLWFQYEV